MKELAEIVPLNLSSDNTIASSINFLSTVGFAPILASKKDFPPPISLLRFEVVNGRIDGYVYDRLFEPFLREAFFLLEEGATATEIDDVLRSRLGIAPFQHVLERGLNEGKTYRAKPMKALYKTYSKAQYALEKVKHIEQYFPKDAEGNIIYPVDPVNLADPVNLTVPVDPVEPVVPVYKTQPGTLPERQNPDPDEPAPVPQKKLTRLSQWYSELPFFLRLQTDYITGIPDPLKTDGFEIIEKFRKDNVRFDDT
jgi:3-hydroxyacyl-CoA dehydrogenase, C-terminal domain